MRKLFPDRGVRVRDAVRPASLRPFSSQNFIEHFKMQIA